MRAEDKLRYPTDERTRFRVRVELNDDLSGTPRVEWVRGCRTLEEAQRGYIALRDASGYGASQFGFGQVLDEAGQLIGHVSHNGRLWAPSPDGGSPWRPGVLAVAEAPDPAPSGRAPIPAAPQGGGEGVADLLVSLRRGFQLPTSFVIGLEGSFEADDDICEARESAPEDNCSRWRVVSSGEVAAEAGDGRQVEIEITGLAWL